MSNIIRKAHTQESLSDPAESFFNEDVPGYDVATNIEATVYADEIAGEALANVQAYDSAGSYSLVDAPAAEAYPNGLPSIKTLPPHP